MLRTSVLLPSSLLRLQVFSSRRILALSALTWIGCFAQIPQAQAQFFLFGDDHRPRYRRIPAEAYHVPKKAHRVETPAVPVAAPKKARKPDPDIASIPLYAVVSIEDQHVSIYGNNGLIERSDISTGTAEHPTPTGIYAIIQKERWHESNIYSGAPMPFMQRITWSGVAMHTGQLPGYPASHGCIRLPGSFAERWYGMTKVGLRVLIAPTDVSPEPIAHPNLPVPRYWAVPGVAAVREPVQSAGLSNEALVALAAPTEAVINPIGYAVAEKQIAKAELKRSEQAEGIAGDAVEAATREAKQAASKLKAAEREAAEAHDRLAWFGLIGNRPPPSPRANFGSGLMVAIAGFEAANTQLNAAKRADSTAKLAAIAAEAAVKRADDRTEELKARIAEMSRRQETVSIFISRKDERLYVRQGLRAVFDIPVKIREADTPLGNHVFVASQPAPGERALRWTALTMPVEVAPPAKVARLKRAQDSENDSIATSIFTESAAGALGRLQLSGEVMDQLSEYVWAGASLIVSDHGITHETGVGTDFVIETRH